MTALVRFDHVRKDYGGEVSALADVSFAIERGDRIALLGRSGSGKSTLLNLAAGLETPSRGTVDWPGLLGDLRPAQIGIAFQSSGLIPWLSAVENVRLPLLLTEIKRPADPAVLMTSLGVGDVAAKLPDELSGGQAQRIALARAMVTTPALLLADEPSGQLDHRTGQHVLHELTRWADDNAVTLVVATHDPAIAALMPKRWTLDHGQFMEIPQ